MSLSLEAIVVLLVTAGSWYIATTHDGLLGLVRTLLAYWYSGLVAVMFWLEFRSRKRTPPKVHDVNSGRPCQ